MPNSLTYGIYYLHARLTLTFAAPLFLAYALLTGKHQTGLRQRQGYYNNFCSADKKEPENLIHDASEVGVMAAKCIFAPIDLSGAVSRSVAAIHSDLYICLETWLSQAMLSLIKVQGALLFLLDARLNERSFRQYNMVRSFANQILAGFETIATIKEGDADRFNSLSAGRSGITVTESAKYNTSGPTDIDNNPILWRDSLALEKEKPVIVAGSPTPVKNKTSRRLYMGLSWSMPQTIFNPLPGIMEEIESTGPAITCWAK